jgi:catechol 2,3-dioxygenase-like lactoylglutathione lyase family enzyme
MTLASDTTLDCLARAGVDVGLVVRDVDASRHFYCDIIGLRYMRATDVPGVGVIHRIDMDGSTLKLMEAPTAGQQQTPISDNSITAEAGLRYLTFHVRSVDDIVRRCREDGGTVLKEPERVPTGFLIAMLADPDSAIVELAEAASGDQR